MSNISNRTVILCIYCYTIVLDVYLVVRYHCMLMLLLLHIETKICLLSKIDITISKMHNMAASIFPHTSYINSTDAVFSNHLPGLPDLVYAPSRAHTLASTVIEIVCFKKVSPRKSGEDQNINFLSWESNEPL